MIKYFLFSVTKYNKKDILSFTEKECIEKCVIHYTMEQMAFVKQHNCEINYNDFWIIVK